MKKHLLLFALLVLAAPTQAAPDSRFVRGIFSDLRYIEEAGDIVGQEIIIVPDGFPTYKAFVQCDEGSFGPTFLVPVKVDGDRVSFAVPAPAFCAGTFVGQATKAGLKGSWTFGSGKKVFHEKVFLKRKHSYWDI